MCLGISHMEETGDIVPRQMTERCHGKVAKQLKRWFAG